jgi:hypothetical protein
MVRKNFITQLAITSRPKLFVTVLVYAISTTVRFTSPAGQETEIATHSAQRTDPMTTGMTKYSAQVFYEDWGLKTVQPIIFHPGWQLSARGCRAASERPLLMPSMARCSRS